MKRWLIYLTLALLGTTGRAAAQALRWERTLSGWGSAGAWAGAATPDGGFVMLATTADGRGLDMPDSLRGGSDDWLLKYDAAGTRQWSRRYGGNRDEVGWSIVPTSDGGYFFGGESTSDRSGDYSQRARGAWDYWVVKTDGLGNKQWDRRFGTDSMDFVRTCWQTADGGYIVAGNTYNGAYPARPTPPQGDKTEPGRGLYDIWVVKMDAQGNKMWDRTLGGVGNDVLGKGIATADGGFLLVGSTASPAGGDVTQPPLNPAAGADDDDVWVLKFDAAGVKQWDRRFGGNDGEVALKVCRTRDGGYALGCASWSGQGGDRSQPSRGGCDYWVLRLNATGQKVWDRRFGTAEDDFLYDILETPSRDLVVLGNTTGGANGDKTQPNFCPAGSGGYNMWTLRLSATGVPRWNRTYGGSVNDFATVLLPSAASGAVLVGYSSSPPSGTRTQPQRGAGDAWVQKVDSLGAPQWDRTAVGVSDEQQTALVQTADRGYASVGFGIGAWGQDYAQRSGYGDGGWLVKRDSLGVARWDTAFAQTARYYRPVSLHETPDRGLLVGGTVFSGNVDYCWSRQPLDAEFNAVKFTARNQVAWDSKSFGGPGDDWLAEARQTADLGFMMGGTSRSGIGRDKSEASRGGADFWLLKTNVARLKTWDHRYGGSGLDSLVSVRQTADGGYILAGSTVSPIGGDVTEAGRGGADYWLVKTNNLGVVQWQHRYGGPANDWLASARPTPDGGYLLLGTTFSGIGGEVTQASLGRRDLWVVKVNATGTLQWQRRYGGSGNEYAATLEVDPDGGYILGASTDSPVSGDISQPSRGGTDYWLLRIGPGGAPYWDKRLGGAGEDVLSCLTTTRGYGYAVGGKSNSPTASGEHQQPNKGGYDYWTVVLGANRVVLGTAPAALAAGLALYPNPGTGAVALALAGLRPQPPVRAEVLNALGQVVLRQALPVRAGAIAGVLEVGGLAPGAYVLRLLAAEGPLTRRLVRE